LVPEAEMSGHSGRIDQALTFIHGPAKTPW
jgi:hypothetical protein